MYFFVNRNNYDVSPDTYIMCVAIRMLQLVCETENPRIEETFLGYRHI